MLNENEVCATIRGAKPLALIMKAGTTIIILVLFGLFYSCNENSENKKEEFIESKLFGNVKSIETKTFENDTLKSRELVFYTESGKIERKETD